MILLKRFRFEGVLTENGNGVLTLNPKWKGHLLFFPSCLEKIYGVPQVEIFEVPPELRNVLLEGL